MRMAEGWVVAYSRANASIDLGAASPVTAAARAGVHSAHALAQLARRQCV